MCEIISSSLKVLVIGSGGREHAIVRCLARSEDVQAIYCANGNPGISLEKKTFIANISLDFSSILDFIKGNSIDFVVIGPEQPLASGLSDFLRDNGIKVFAPSKYAAQLETSKKFAKDFMSRHNIPTATYKSFVKSEQISAFTYIDEMNGKIVLKADGLAGGKGVVISDTKDDAKNALSSIFDGKFGEAGEKVVIEEFMAGEEASLFVITDGVGYVVLPASQDHKRINDGNTGKNTGGMGAVTPIPLITDEMLESIRISIIEPTLYGMKDEGHEYVGCLYVGLMILPNGKPKVVEYNCRFGDPETQAVLSIFEGDFAKLLYSAASGSIDKNAFVKSSKSACTIILASAGYPDKYEIEKEITCDFSNTDDVIVYHSGTKLIDNKLLTAGGRVLSVTAIADNLSDAIYKAYEKSEQIHFEGKYNRTDIGKKWK